MRENASGSDFTSDWLRKWREKLFTQSQKRLANLKRGKTRVTKLRFFYPKVNTSKQPEVRENASGSDFTSDWLRKWREKLFTQSQKRLANLKRGKTRVTKLRFFYPKVNTSKQPEVRENASGFDFTSD